MRGQPRIKSLSSGGTGQEGRVALQGFPAPGPVGPLFANP